MTKIVSFIASLALALVAIAIMYWLNSQVLIPKISEFMIGWISCGIFMICKNQFDSNA